MNGEITVSNIFALSTNLLKFHIESQFDEWKIPI